MRPATDLDEVLADDEIDVVDLCTPPHLHRAQVETVLRAGKDVFCEKPLVGSVAEVDELASIAAETGRTVMPILQYRFGHGIQKLRRVVDLGLAGKPYVANVDVAWLRGQDYYDAVAGRWATELGGALLSHAVHALDMLLLVMGPPSVFARTATLVNDIEVEDSAAITFRFPTGARGHVRQPRVAPRSRGTGSASSTSPPSRARSPTPTARSPGSSASDGDAAGAHRRATQPVEEREDYAGQFERYAGDGDGRPASRDDGRRPYAAGGGHRGLRIGPDGRDRAPRSRRPSARRLAAVKDTVPVEHTDDARGRRPLDLPVGRPQAPPPPPGAHAGGAVLTRDAPEDHPWHHGLWFTIKFVDDDNFWEEMAPYGVLRHDGPPEVEVRRTTRSG